MLILAAVDSCIATITLNRPERHNSLIPSLLEELCAAVTAVGEDERVAVVLFQANGRSFSTGGT